MTDTDQDSRQQKKALLFRQIWIKKKFHPAVIELMGGLEKMCHYPTLAWKQAYCALDYIDQIPPGDVDHPIMIGEDGRGRPFIVFKASRDQAKICCHVLFQREADNPLTWADASNSQRVDDLIFKSSGYWLSNGRLDDQMAENIQSLLTGEDLKHYRAGRIEKVSFRLVK